MVTHSGPYCMGAVGMLRLSAQHWHEEPCKLVEAALCLSEPRQEGKWEAPPVLQE